MIKLTRIAKETHRWGLDECVQYYSVHLFGYQIEYNGERGEEGERDKRKDSERHRDSRE